MNDILHEVCQAILSMDPERIAEVEMRIPEARSSLERMEDRASADSAIRQLRTAQSLVSHAEDLLGGWIQILSASVSGYTAEGTAAVCPHGRIAMKG